MDHRESLRSESGMGGRSWRVVTLVSMQITRWVVNRRPRSAASTLTRMVAGCGSSLFQQLRDHANSTLNQASGVRN